MSARELSPRECRSLLQSKKVGRVVYTDNALPSALPVNYMLDGDAIIFRTEQTGRLASTVAAEGSVLAFQVDSIEEEAESGWSVLVVGLARQVSDPEEALGLQRLGLSAWGLNGTGVYVRIPLARVTGRAVVATRQHSSPRDYGDAVADGRRWA